MPGLQFIRCRIVLRCTTAMELEPTIGANLRGDFGCVLRQATCAQRAADGRLPPSCETCSCSYGDFFVQPQSGQPGSNGTRPYIFEPLDARKTHYGAGEEFQFNFILVGEAMKHLNLCITTFQQLGERGMGRNFLDGAGRLQVVRVCAESLEGNGTVIFEHGQQGAIHLPQPLGADAIAARVGTLTHHRVRMFFVQPTEIREAGQPLQSFEFHQLWDALTTRLKGLMACYCDSALELDFKALKLQAQCVRKVEDTLHWQEQTRRSRRQHDDIPVSGLVGHVCFEGELAPFLPALVAGEWLHVGHKCVTGNGQYHLAACR